MRTSQQIQQRPRASSLSNTVPRARPSVASPLAVHHAHGCTCGGTCPRCRHAAANAMTSGVSDALRSSSQSLDLSTRTFMESRFGRDFGNVRIHTGPIAAAASRAMNADAFTIDRDIVFAEGAYSPASATGRRLIAHELTHVEQQRVGASGVSGGTHAEREARDVSTAVAHGGRATVRHGAPTMAQRQEAEGSRSTGAAASSPDFQLHLDPEIEVQMARMFVRWWLGTTLVAGDAPTTISGWSAGGL